MSEPKQAKQILEDVLSKVMVKEIWSANCAEAIPFSMQYFTVGSILPAVLYMFRRSYRRGTGTFRQTFAPQPDEMSGKVRKVGKDAIPTAASVARVLSMSNPQFLGFEALRERHILADLMLSYCLENQEHESGRTRPLIRAFPTHYLSAWIDLPDNISHLRFVPEALVAVLTNQDTGEAIDRKAVAKSWFRTGTDFDHNLLLKLFGQGMKARELQADLNEDFEEQTEVGIDQLLTIRIAKACGAAPKRASDRGAPNRPIAEGRGQTAIPNQHPISRQAMRILSEDFRTLCQAFGQVVPRHGFLPMLESCIGIGLAGIMRYGAASLFEWEQTGTLPKECRSLPLFVDCSSSSDRELRYLAEDSMQECIRRLQRLPVVFMALRILSFRARMKLGKSLPSALPDATDRINLLGDILCGRHPQSATIRDVVEEACVSLAEQLEADELAESVVYVLRSAETTPSPIWRLAEAVSLLMGDKLQSAYVVRTFDCCLMTDEPNGMAVQRRVRFSDTRSGKRSGIARSIVLKNTMLDFLVHRHLRKPGKRKGSTSSHPLSFTNFLEILRDRYGLYVDQAPPGQSISMELLLRNRRMLEGRLRDLGLLVGVNDAESMKRLRPRFEARDVEVQHDGRE